MSSPQEFEDHLVALSDNEYEALVQERIARLNAEQQTIAQAREVVRKEQMRLIRKLASSTEPETHEMIFNALRDMDNNDNCEHGRPMWKHCDDCGEIDHIMFPELVNADGFRIDEEE
jgi:DNA mismatch repair ATPase MutL